MRVPRLLRACGLTAFLCGGLAFYLLFWQPVWLFHWRDYREGNRIITAIDAFQVKNGRLPETLEEIGIRQNDPTVFYQKVAEREYRVWFGTSLGESEIYDSQTKAWR